MSCSMKTKGKNPSQSVVSESNLSIAKNISLTHNVRAHTHTQGTCVPLNWSCEKVLLELKKKEVICREHEQYVSWLPTHQQLTKVDLNFNKRIREPFSHSPIRVFLTLTLTLAPRKCEDEKWKKNYVKLCKINSNELFAAHVYERHTVQTRSFREKSYNTLFATWTKKKECTHLCACVRARTHIHFSLFISHFVHLFSFSCIYISLQHFHVYLLNKMNHWTMTWRYFLFELHRVRVCYFNIHNSLPLCAFFIITAGVNHITV